MGDDQAPAGEPKLGDAWGDAISEERQAELQALSDKQREWAAQPETTRGESVFTKVALSGADVFWLADQSGRDAVGQVPNLHLEGAALFGAQLQHADLAGAHLQHADLSVAELQGATLVEAQLQHSDLTGAQLEGTALFGAQLQQADLSVAHLQHADLTRAQLQGADLRGAQLQGTTLTRAKNSPALDGQWLMRQQREQKKHDGEQKRNQGRPSTVNGYFFNKETPGYAQQDKCHRQHDDDSRSPIMAIPDSSPLLSMVFHRKPPSR
jgi:hypothetical protein